ncbi:fungal pheromone STE3G-protein-coupled receptor [Peniophora sp. CONT]|nr:fungal pheromone STE3G-protein-coupled receptor [Peniophora sp. CONT]
MHAADPTYPLYPIACAIAAMMLLLVLLTSFMRQSWNLGVALLCFWLFFENVSNAINAVVWVDNADIKLYIYCDIVTRLQLITAVVKPMATLIITRRLYLITSLQSVELPNKTAKRTNLAIECMLGLVIPILVSGPLYYVVQGARFQVVEAFGCGTSLDSSILAILIVYSWTVIPPLLSITIYYPRVIRICYRQSRDINHFLQSNDSVSRTNYIRIIILASIDVFLTLPSGIVSIALAVAQSVAFGDLLSYPGWTEEHSDWTPSSVSYQFLLSLGTFEVAESYFSQWISPLLTFAIFGLFGVTSEARASYWRVICAVSGWFGWKPTQRTRDARSPPGTMELGERQQDISLDVEIG